VPISGGKDSSYILFYLVNELKLNPLALLVDTGYQTHISIANVKTICKILKTDLIIAYPSNYRKLVVSEALKISFFLQEFWCAGICGHCERILRSTTIREARKRSIPTIIWGSTDFEDTTISYQKDWNSIAFKDHYGSRKSIKEVLKYLLNYRKKFKLSFTFLLHALKFWIYMVLLNFDLGINGFFNKINPSSQVLFNQKDLNVIYFFDFIKYDPINQIEILKEKLNWKSPPNREIRSDCSLSIFAEYRFMKKTGSSKTGFILSTLIRHGLISRNEALSKEMEIKKDLKTVCRGTLNKLQGN
jgi:hypothetical protein